MSYIFSMCEIKKYKVIDGHKLCRKCNELLPVDNFRKSPKIKSGYNSWCRSCENPYVKKQPSSNVVDGYKICKKCNELLPVNKFRENLRIKSGLHSYCIDCCIVPLSHKELQEEKRLLKQEGELLKKEELKRNKQLNKEVLKRDRLLKKEELKRNKENKLEVLKQNRLFKEEKLKRVNQERIEKKQEIERVKKEREELKLKKSICEIKKSNKREIIDGKLYCKNCDTHHPVEMFNKSRDFYNSQCKTCQKISHRKWLVENQEHQREYSRGYKKKVNEQKKEVRLKLKNELLQQKSIERERIQREKEEIKRLKAEQHQYEKEQREIQRKLKVEEYRNSEEYKQKKRDRENRKFNNRIQRDPLFKFRKSLGNSIRNSFRRGGFTKSSKSYDILGEEWEVIKVYFESRFTIGMSWDNHGEWHIDHILPISLATCEEDVIMLNHYTNLQPLWAEDNLLKSDNILVEGSPFYRYIFNG